MKNPKVYFTLNNYVPNNLHGVAYYAIDAVGDPLHLTVDQWRNAAHVRDHVIGQQMYLHSNNNGANFNNPQAGKYVVIFQNIDGVAQVVSHVLQFVDTVVHDIGNAQDAKALKLSSAFVQHWGQWRFMRRCVVRAILNPNAFDAGVNGQLHDLVSTRVVDRPIMLGDLTLGHGIIPNGNVYAHHGHHQPIDFDHMVKTIKANNNYISDLLNSP